MKPVTIERATRETDITLKLGRSGALEVGPPLFRHFFGALALTSGLPVELKATGDLEVDPHHLIEDVGICLGQALREATGGYSGLCRYGFSLVPMDGALVRVALDLSGRTYCRLGGFPKGSLGSVTDEALAEFFEGLCRGGALTLHADLLVPAGLHHAFEALFKAVGVALEAALAEREGGPRSTKGVIA